MAAKKKPAGGEKAKRPADLGRMLRDDPNTAALARELNVTVDEYVKQVLQFAAHPELEPQLVVVDDDDLRSQGFEPADGEAMGQYLVDLAAVAEAGEGSGFSAATKAKVALPQAPPPAATGAKPGLAEDVARARKGRGKV